MREIWDELKMNRESGARKLVAEYGNRLYAASRLVCANAHDAEELVFRTFERAVACIDQYEPKGSFFAWLYVIMLNFRRMDLRRQRPEIVPVGMTSELPEREDTSLADALSGVDAEGIRQALGKLPYAQSEVLVLRFFEGLSMDEIAQLEKIPVGTVKSRLHHAKAALRAALVARGIGS